MTLKSEVQLLVASSKSLLEGLGERALLISALAPSTTRVSIGARRTTQTFLDASIATLGVKIRLRSDRCGRDDRVVGELDVALKIDVPSRGRKLIGDITVVLVGMRRCWRMVYVTLSRRGDLENAHMNYEIEEISAKTHASTPDDFISHSRIS